MSNYDTLKKNHQIAIERYKNGEKPNVSSTLEDEITYGYGEVDEYGFWEFPLYEDDMEDEEEV